MLRVASDALAGAAIGVAHWAGVSTGWTICLRAPSLFTISASSTATNAVKRVSTWWRSEMSMICVLYSDWRSGSSRKRSSRSTIRDRAH